MDTQAACLEPPQSDTFSNLPVEIRQLIISNVIDSTITDTSLLVLHNEYDSTNMKGSLGYQALVLSQLNTLVAIGTSFSQDALLPLRRALRDHAKRYTDWGNTPIDVMHRKPFNMKLQYYSGWCTSLGNEMKVVQASLGDLELAIKALEHTINCGRRGGQQAIFLNAREAACNQVSHPFH